jgi:hypothetical protein
MSATIPEICGTESDVPLPIMNESLYAAKMDTPGAAISGCWKETIVINGRG